MKAYTCRYAHLEELPIPLVNDIIYRGDKVGRMGSTGQSKFNHLHIDVVHTYVDRILRLSQIGYEIEHDYVPSIEQLNYFIDNELFGIKPVITTYFYDPEYKVLFGKDHPAYDLTPMNRHDTEDNFNIYWNRSKAGIILKIGYDKLGYGYYVLIGFEA